jgi:hypothetical protein
VTVESVKILPVASGYRDNEDKRLKFTTAYSNIYERMLENHPSVAHVQPSDFEIVIPYREIESANIFDPQIYNSFFIPVPSNSSTAVDIEPSDAGTESPKLLTE